MGNLVILGLIPPTGRTQNTRDLSTVLKSLDAECRNCSPISPLQCINRCKAYKLKNELRTLRKAMATPSYVKDLFNVLKNETRLHILQAIANGRYSVDELQQVLKKSGHSHSQGNITEEYLHPLATVGLVAQAGDEFYATMFGDRLTQPLAHFREFAAKLPAHSECHEETLLQSLLAGPKTFEDIEAVISPETTSRVLKRLCKAKLVRTRKAKDYIFFFKSKRDPGKENLTRTQKRIHDALSQEGISAGRLADQTGLSRRITYKYLRGLRGKKLVFSRRTPKEYRLTVKGEKLASALQQVQQIVEDTWSSCEIVMQDTELTASTGGYLNHALIT
jgi:DNA-binding HxlR family transcriptional regulator